MLEKSLFNRKSLFFWIMFSSLGLNVNSMDENNSLISNKKINYIVDIYSYENLPQPCIKQDEILLHNLDTCIVMKRQAIAPILNILSEELNADISFPNTIKLEGMSNNLIKALAVALNNINRIVYTIKTNNKKEANSEILKIFSKKFYQILEDFPDGFEELISVLIKSSMAIQKNRFKEVLVNQSEISVAIKNMVNKNHSESITCSGTAFVVGILLCIGCIISTQISTYYLEDSNRKSSRIYSTFVLIFAVVGAIFFGCCSGSCAYLTYNTRKEKKSMLRMMELLENETYDIESLTQTNNSIISEIVPTRSGTKYKSKFKRILKTMNYN